VSDTWSLANPVHRFEFKPLHNNHDAPREGDIMLIQYFTRPSRIDELRNCPSGHLLEGFAKELAAAGYQWVAARQHIRTAEHFLRWIGHLGFQPDCSSSWGEIFPERQAADGTPRYGAWGRD
jgi:hypothetical protein